MLDRSIILRHSRWSGSCK